MIDASTCGSLARGFHHPVSRRNLLGVGLLAAGSALLIRPPVLGAAPITTTWGLDPDGARAGCGCHACAACRAHAHYKLFASAADADAGRAHPHCRCQVVSFGALDLETYTTLFLQGGGRTSVDKRTQWVQAALAASPSPPPAPVAPPAPAPARASGAPSNPPGTAPQLGSPGVIATAHLRAAWIRRLGPNRRTLFVQLEASQPLEATISLHRRGRALARRTLILAKGRQTVRLQLAPTVAKGPASARVRFATGSAPATRAVSVPAKHARTKHK
jgi:hypothetical protein